MPTKSKQTQYHPLSFPCRRTSRTPGTNATIPNLESYMLEITRGLGETTNAGTPTAQFIVIDEEGLRNGTVVLLERHVDDDVDDEDDIVLTDKFDKVRLPWKKVHSIFVNLDLANMDFRDFTDWQEGDAEGWFEYVDFGDDLPEKEREEREREREIERLRGEGLVD
ncbi:hypothetical protein B0A48_06210 [Cryoendolithus antarcticus]|uniref:DUF6924 domain-containing protein n=1 Tax=Cryoendolithus antarcticus TaxID=1507870 RepID=A0A1V8TAE9_9PEZI|nr:hypothetical protein B0A48_06210 [Cryoendolithus antarcticus]